MYTLKRLGVCCGGGHLAFLYITQRIMYMSHDDIIYPAKSTWQATQRCPKQAWFALDLETEELKFKRLLNEALTLKLCKCGHSRNAHRGPKQLCRSCNGYCHMYRQVRNAK